MRWMTIAIMLMLASICSAFVVDGSGHYSDCLNFDLLISVGLGVSSNNYMTIIGTERGPGTYNVFIPGDAWYGSDEDYGIVIVCCAAAGLTSRDASWTSDNVNVIMSNKTITMSTSTARSMLDMDKTDAQWRTWIGSHVTMDNYGCDDIAALAGY